MHRNRPGHGGERGRPVPQGEKAEDRQRGDPRSAPEVESDPAAAPPSVAAPRTRHRSATSVQRGAARTREGRPGFRGDARPSAAQGKAPSLPRRRPSAGDRGRPARASARREFTGGAARSGRAQRGAARSWSGETKKGRDPPRSMNSEPQRSGGLSRRYLDALSASKGDLRAEATEESTASMPQRTTGSGALVSDVHMFRTSSTSTHPGSTARRGSRSRGGVSRRSA